MEFKKSKLEFLTHPSPWNGSIMIAAVSSLTVFFKISKLLKGTWMNPLNKGSKLFEYFQNFDR